MKNSFIVKRIVAALMLAGSFTALSAFAQQPTVDNDSKINKTFVSLADNANAVIAEPPAMDKVRSHIALLIAHPEHLNMFDYFLGPEFAKRGYRTMMMNYYGREESYEEFLAPIAAAVRYLKSQPGIDKVVFAAHSTGGAELTYYQDVAENGSKACQGPERIYPCKKPIPSDLPKADGIMLLDIHIGGPLRTLSIDPAVSNNNPRQRSAALDMFDAHNGFNAKIGKGTYTREFERKFFAAQRARNIKLVDAALTRLGEIEKGAGKFADDEPFLVAGGSVRMNGALLHLADTRLLTRTHAPHLFLKADGTTPTQIIPSLAGAPASANDLGRLNDTAQNGTVRHYLSFFGMRTTADYEVTEDDIKGIVWRSSANSAPGNIEGIRAPTLILAGSCWPHLVPNEITYDHSPANDKQFAAVEGADHYFSPCKSEYGDTKKRALDFADAWLAKPGRF